MRKKICLLCLSVLFLIICLTACRGTPKIVRAYLNEDNCVIVEYSDGTQSEIGGLFLSSNKVVDTRVDESYHLILTYEDGTVEDAGFVGVALPLYTVTFLNASGEIIETQQVYYGQSAIAPEPPVETGYVFVGWSLPFDDVQEDLSVQAVYSPMDAFTVTFADSDGTVLKTESVLPGCSATAPANPKKTGKIFDKWDKSFDNVTSDMTVAAVYRDPKTYTVTFLDYSGVLLGKDEVSEGETASLPFTPTREGYTFYDWTDSVRRVSSNLTVRARYKITKTDNAFDLAASIKNNTLTVTVAMKSDVKFCGLQGSVSVPEELTFVNSADESGMMTNFAEGRINFMYSSQDGKDVTETTTLATLTFTIGDEDISEVTLETVLDDIYDQEMNTVSYTILGQTVKLK